MTLREATAPMTAVLPQTAYFEYDSEAVGARFGVWVTLPPRYEAETEATYPVVYQPDGNQAAPLTAPLSWLLRDDPINPIDPFIQVSVGYTGDDVHRLLAVRARDLLPPGEPLPSGVDEAAMDGLVRSGMLDADAAARYLTYLRNPRGDAFLTFLTDELHPAVAGAYRVDETRTGLHGFSYGGLFAVFAALSTSHFSRVGAGSPGIMSGSSRVLELYAEAVATATPETARRLHVTMSEREVTVSSAYQPLVAAGTTEFLLRAGAQPVPGMSVSSSLIRDESHATGYGASWFSYLRECYAADQRTQLLARLG